MYGYGQVPGHGQQQDDGAVFDRLFSGVHEVGSSACSLSCCLPAVTHLVGWRKIKFLNTMPLLVVASNRAR